MKIENKEDNKENNKDNSIRVNSSAKVTIEHHNSKGELLHREVKHNLIPTAGRDQLHLQCYGLSGLATMVASSMVELTLISKFDFNTLSN